ncbi:MAG: cyclodeaminase/cyclohydrolase family protein [Ruminococcaceae bacterium]|nr:cyclodeaminase/cyclohydrolase family protein [Oscillospiraceae bacterium]
MNDLTINQFLESLSSEAPVPGGGGASALMGGLSAALCSMVASLTTGKKKYAEYQSDIERMLTDTAQLRSDMQVLIEKDAEVFEPLSKAYSIPKDDPNRAEILEEALRVACSAPLEIMKTACKIVPVLEELTVKGSKIALSDVGVAAVACQAAIQGGVLNVYINTKLMQDREYAKKINNEAEQICKEFIGRCEKVYKLVETHLMTK